MDKQQDFEKKINTYKLRIGDATQDLRQGVIHDISYLEKEIGLFCQELLTAPPQIAKSFEEEMLQLIKQLDIFMDELKDFQKYK